MSHQNREDHAGDRLITHTSGRVTSTGSIGGAAGGRALPCATVVLYSGGVIALADSQGGGGSA